MPVVALHPEGVDRNPMKTKSPCRDAQVALHPEGVDRNLICAAVLPKAAVALHPEGVDRNYSLKK